MEALRLRQWWHGADRRYGVWWRLLNGAVAVLVLVSVVIPLLQQLALRDDYRLSAEALQLVGQSNPALARQLSYDSQTATYTFNAAAEATTPSSITTKLQAQVGAASGQGADKSLYALDVPADFTRGVTYHDTNSQLAFSLRPEFKGQTGRVEQGHLVFPLAGGSQAVYTLKGNGLKEDIVVPKVASDSLSFSYHLQLPDTLQAKVIPGSDGAIGVYSADPALFGNISYGSNADQAAVEKARVQGNKTYLVFGLPSPVVKTTDGRQVGNARFQLHGDQLTVVATGLSGVTAPITVDPSVVVTSGSDFQTDGNNEDNIDFSTAGRIGRAGLTGGSVMGSGWTAATAFAIGRGMANSVAYGGYLYLVGGLDVNGSALNDVQYAPLNSDGTLGSWTAANSFTTGRYGFNIAAYDGYLYIFGGEDDGENALNDVQYAPLNADGSVGTWKTTTSFDTPRYYFGATTYNGYLYITGGVDGTATQFDDVQYAPLNADGSVGTWKTTTSFADARSSLDAVAYNGYLYVMGGYDGTSLYDEVQYAPLNADGSVGTWNYTNNFSNPRSDFSALVYGGYLYVIAGYSGGKLGDVQYAPVYANGTVGAWATTTSLSTARFDAAVASYDGYLYVMGGYTSGTTVTTSVEHAKVDPAGQVQNWQSGSGLGTVNKRALSCAVAYNGMLYSLGGSTDDSNANNVAKVLGAPLYSDGSIGSWTSSGMSALPAVGGATAGRGAMGCVAANNKLYVIGGNTDSGSNDGAVLYATIASSGNIGSWTISPHSIASLNAAYTPSHNGVFVYDGYLYSVGGDHSSGSGADHNQGVYYAPLNSDGSVGTWAATSSLLGNYSTRAYALDNGYLYAMGGINSGGASNTAAVEYAVINSDGSVGTWAATASLPTAFADTQGVTINGCIYLAGGEMAASGAVNSTYYACPGSDGTIAAWQTAPSLVRATTDMAMTSYGGWLYGIGGWVSAAVAAVESAAVNNGGSGMAEGFSTTSGVSAGREGVATVASGGYLYAMGGSDGTSYSAATSYAPFRPNGTLGSWSTTSSLLLGRRYAGAVVDGDYLYILGGDVGSPGTVTLSKETEVAHIKGDGSLGAWVTGSDMPTSMYAFGTAVWNHRVYLTGGNPGGASSDVSYASLSNGSIGSWSSGPSFTTARFGHATVAYSGYLYVIGGATAGNDLLGDVQYAAINSDGSLGSWASTSGIPARRFVTATAANGYLYVFGGTDTSSNSKNDVLVASIGGNGTLGAWSYAGTLGTARFGASANYYGGYLYVLGGRTGDTYDDSLESSVVDAPARVAHYSKLIDLGNLANVTSITYNGTLPGGGASISYRGAGDDGVFDISGTASDPAPSSCVNGSRYIWVDLTFDDSLGGGSDGAFPDDATNTGARLTDFTVNYSLLHPEPANRLRGGQTLQEGVQGSSMGLLGNLDTCSD